MCSNQTKSTKELGEQPHKLERLERSLAQVERRNIILTLWSTFQALQSEQVIGLHHTLPSIIYNTGHASWTSHGTMGAWLVRNV